MARLYPDPDDMALINALNLGGLVGMPEPYGAVHAATSARLAETLDRIWAEDEGLYGFLRVMDAVLMLSDGISVMLGKAMAASPAPVACVAGCALCCQRDIGLGAMEAVYLALSLADENKTVRTLAAGETVCPLLGENDLCSVHVWRPLACRLWISRQLGSCEAATGADGYDPERGTGVLGAPSYFHFQLSLVSAFTALLTRRGLDRRRFSLRRDLGRLVENPAALEAWFSGENLPAQGVEAPLSDFAATVHQLAFAADERAEGKTT